MMRAARARLFPGLVLLPVAALFVGSADAQVVRLSRGYLTPKEITDPASFSVQRGDSLWHTKLDGALIFGTSAAFMGLPAMTIEGGYYASVGTIRDKSARVHGPWGGVTTDVGPILADAKLAWESTDAKVRAYTGTLRVSPLTWRAVGIGRPLRLATITGGRLRPPEKQATGGSHLDLAWRPYLGFQRGKLQRAPQTLEVAEGETFSRLLGTADALLRAVRVRRFPADLTLPADSTKIESRFELSGKATLWRLQELAETRTHFVFGIALPVSSKVKIKLDWEKAEKPPAFKQERSVALGLGVSL